MVESKPRLRLVSLCVLALFLASAMPGSAHALSCGLSSPEEVIATASLFQGRLVSRLGCDKTDRDACTGSLQGVFEVQHVWKGSFGGIAIVAYHAGSGGFGGEQFQVGRSYRMAVVEIPGKGLRTGGSCLWYSAFAIERTGEVLELADRYHRDLANLDDAIRIDPDNPAARVRRARFLFDHGESSYALAVVDAMLALHPRDRDGLLLKAETLSHRGQAADALSIIDALLTADPADHGALRGKVATLVHAGRLHDVDPAWRDFSGMAFKNVDFSGRDLDGASFRSSKLLSISFTKANLQGANFSEATLRRVSFANANLADANFAGIGVADGVVFRGTNLRGADLRGMEMGRMDLRGTDLRGANLLAADLRGAVLVGSLYDEATVWPSGLDPVGRGAVRIE